ncbi:N-acetylglucosamine-6-phosphate deacetylase [Sulfitobacter noctilucicola]|uniref:N-acetylglucosamine-6-phosphate deacetylase n=1 Tax=Sulfitobacter noctilucicola TaxID=1342301 RepID=A0A7W6M9C2_9RHOB|nr:N-acetylglucosamine-6-phosphate deacetylase [Sulfitobacter noctilucicola]KIN63646.1 N-acetylglucosamine-6-phosphate deacetylase [Sulfitobacter noctilucicola]MBB4174844.1 N-acetylglucosamine-6-phosphate deacetylase [Sulfitobacter noctilucicola]
MKQSLALVGANVFDGTQILTAQAVIVEGNAAKVVPETQISKDTRQINLDGGTIMPGFVDLQVNGGGGLMFNSAPTVETVEIMAQAHMSLGTRAFLPTLITDRPKITAAAIEAVRQAVRGGVKGVAGLHLEGPHLNVVKKGAHDAGLIRAMTTDDMKVLLDAADSLPNLMVTLAPETVSLSDISTLADAGVIVSLGHSDTDYDTAMRAFDAGARCATHLFNAMSPLTSRAPGLVGAAMSHPQASAGLIADGVHVHPATIRLALAAHKGPRDIFVVTDAMACAGSDITHFELNGRQIKRAGGRLTLSDGTLAGADVTMARSLDVLINDVGEPPARALSRTTTVPASMLRDVGNAASLPAQVDDMIHLGADFSVTHLADVI